MRVIAGPASDGIVTVSATGVHGCASLAFESVFGCRRGGLLGRGVAVLFWGLTNQVNAAGLGIWCVAAP